MRSLLSYLATAATCAYLTVAAPSIKQDKRSTLEQDGVTYNVFEHAATGAKLKFVTNSGICETTPGVNQYSGYLSVGSNMNMWFWCVFPLRFWLPLLKVRGFSKPAKILLPHH